MQDNNANSFLILSWLSAYISIGAVQQYVSLFSGLVAIGSGIFAMRYYYLKSKNK